MKFSNTFKIIWWIILILIIGILFYWRLEDIKNGESTPIDILILLILISLLLVPIFAEINIFGIKLKQEIEELKTQMKIQIGDLKNEIRNSQVQTIHQNINGFGPPPEDQEIPKLDAKVEKILKAKLKEYNLEDIEASAPLNVPQDNLMMFQVRYNIENELRRIWINNFDTFEYVPTNRKVPLFQVLRDLTESKIIDKQLFYILREIISVCNYAIHGEEISHSQTDFVKKNAEEIIHILMDIE